MLTRISPCLWFDREAEAAATYYCSVFPNSAIESISHYGDGAPLPAGTPLVVRFRLDGVPLMALNGGPVFTFTEAVSLVVHCETQAEIDHYWNALGDGGDPAARQCGWLKDRYGLSWQIVPAALESLLNCADSAANQRTLQVLMTMKKLDVARLQRAHDGN